MEPQLSFTKGQISQFRQPGVYVYKQNGKALYVGVGAVTGVASRCFSAQHHQCEALEDADCVDMYLCNTKYEATELEIRLIHDLKPVLNREPITDKIRLTTVFQRRKRGDTFEAIAKDLGITRQRAHQLAARAKQFRYRELVQGR